ncbi:MAG: GTPase Era [Bacillota bacterium]
MTVYKSGFVAVIGRPNVGKSTLVNALVGQKVAIVSSKPQTTRNRIVAVVHRDDGQLVLLDTPGLHRPKHRLGDYMVAVARRSLEAVDAVMHVVDASAEVGPGDVHISGLLARSEARFLLVLNKVDLLEGADCDQAGAAYGALARYQARFPVSALSGTGLSQLEDALFDLLPPGPRYYPEDVVTDQPESFLVGELVREKVMELTREEIPHAVASVVEEFLPRPEGSVYVRVVIYVERESQKGIIIGRGGNLLKQVGSRARSELEALLGSAIYLDLWVKVKRDWRNQEAMLRSLGYSAKE